MLFFGRFYMIVPSGILFDLDGVIYQDGVLIDGAKSTIELLNLDAVVPCPHKLDQS